MLLQDDLPGLVPTTPRPVPQDPVRILAHLQPCNPVVTHEALHMEKDLGILPEGQENPPYLSVQLMFRAAYLPSLQLALGAGTYERNHGSRKTAEECESTGKSLALIPWRTFRNKETPRYLDRSCVDRHKSRTKQLHEGVRKRSIRRISHDEKIRSKGPRNVLKQAYVSMRRSFRRGRVVVWWKGFVPLRLTHGRAYAYDASSEAWLPNLDP
mmetsp:Transcript_31705/g.48544  ORF Transcript_31705/g.48544 Transcript_31705/m.48544 type:complete len:212 (-) Transcript_31705:164-799(-)